MQEGQPEIRSAAKGWTVPVALSGSNLQARINLLEQVLADMQRDAIRLRAQGACASALAFSLAVFGAGAVIMLWNTALMQAVGSPLWIGWTVSLGLALLCWLVAWLIFMHRLAKEDSNLPPGFGFGWFGSSSLEEWNYLADNLRGSGLAENILQGYQRDDVADDEANTRHLLEIVGNTLPAHYMRRAGMNHPLSIWVQQLLLLAVAGFVLFLMQLQAYILLLPLLLIPGLFEALYARWHRWVKYLLATGPGLARAMTDNLEPAENVTASCKLRKRRRAFGMPWWMPSRNRQAVMIHIRRANCDGAGTARRGTRGAK